MKLTLIIVVSVAVLIQLYPIDRDNPASDPVHELKMDGEVKMIVETACYDCHSNKTNWPWYSYVAPVSWLVAYDVYEGRSEMNFSEWNTYTAKRINRKFEEIAEEVEEKEMPLPVYLITHAEADIDDDQRNVLINWARSHLQQSVPDSSFSSY